MHTRLSRVVYIFLLILCSFAFLSCDKREQNQDIPKELVESESKEKKLGADTADNVDTITTNPNKSTDLDIPDTVSEQGLETMTSVLSEKENYQFINPDGKTLDTRIKTPLGFEREEAQEGSFLNYLRTLTLKEDGSKVLLYDGREKGNQSSHVAIFELNVGEKDLQQCADSIMRVYGEYYWSIGEYEKLNFHLTNGFLMEYLKWRDGYRIEVDGNQVNWVRTKEYDDSYECFQNYLIQVFIYAGTISLSEESQRISLEDLKIGDMFIYGGSPGHCVLVVDMATDGQGNICFLLAQGFMPAQEFHVINNPLHENDPWYYVSEIEYPLKTPQWTFEEDSLKRWMNE